MKPEIGFRKLIPGLLLIIPVFFSIPAQAQNDEKSTNEHDHIDKHVHKPPFFMGERLTSGGMADNNWKEYHKYGRKHFDELTPEQKEMIKKRRKAFKALPPEEREQIYRARKKFHNMPPEKREQLKAKWRNMSPEDRERAYKKKFKPYKKRKYKEQGNSD